MAAPDKVKALLGDLGKPTLRGVRKCPKCGTYNGTRGISCKNKSCDAVFKDKERKRGHSADSVKIITGSTVQVFSVRLRDRGPDYRGFVQLPLVQDLDGNPAQGVDPAVLAQAARCYVEMCARNTQGNVVGLNDQPCGHIKSAIDCSLEAQPLTLKNSVLNSLDVSNEMKQAIWLLATETTGPLVQRVTKNIMVVKCKPNPKTPLGFLHFAFFETSRNRSSPEHKFHCSCRAFKNFKLGPGRDESTKRCVHFYACVCAFASDDKLINEFSYYIHLDESVAALTTTSPLQETRFVSVFNPAHDSALTPDPSSMEIQIVTEEDIMGPSAKKQKKTNDLLVQDADVVLAAQASSALLTLQDSGGGTSLLVTGNAPKKSSPAKPVVSKSVITPKKPSVPAPSGPTAVDETTTTVSFHQWLASVTERINQTMHYQFDGNPDPLVFHAPQVFFECVQQRISAGYRKKRLPNSTTGFVRKDALPLGTFTKYTWHIISILHVKQIFDTPEMPLEITRNFVENRDGTYDLYEIPKVQVESIDDTYKSKNQTPIRPFELKTYLKVGNTSPNQKDPTPFVIEWIPDILPKSKIGELRIKFEYGHQRNGHIEHRVGAVPSDIQTIHVQEIPQLSL